MLCLLIAALGLWIGVNPARASQSPSGRAYELVSDPADGVAAVDRVPMISEDGDAVVYLAYRGLLDAAGNGLYATTVARRSADGWSSTDISPPLPRAIGGLTPAFPTVFSSDFSRALLDRIVPWDPRDVDGTVDVYRWDARLRAFDWISRSDELPANHPLSNIAGFSVDLSRVVFSTFGPNLLPEAPTGHAVYVRDDAGLRLVSVLPDGTPAPSGYLVASMSEHKTGDGLFAFGHGSGPAAPHRGLHPVSDDGRRVYWITDSNPGSSPLYLWDGDHTITVSASQRTGSERSAHSATFLFASHDGGIVYFESPDQLTNDAPVGGGIYRYDVASEELAELTPDPGSAQGLRLSDQQGTSGANGYYATASDDGSHIYFTSPAALTAGAVPGDWNVYVWSASEGTKLVVALSEFGYVAQATRDGRYAIIATHASIDGAPTGDHAAFYEYDASAGDVACITCRPDGGPSQSDANLDRQPQTGLGGSGTVTRNLTDDGRVFFVTKDHLLPQDVGAGADIYVYDHGSLSLITPGKSDGDAYLADNTDDGRDVFFLTPDRLSALDPNPDGMDLYDARVGGGFAEPRAPARPCQGDDCQGSAPAAPALPRAASESASGPGNVKATPKPVTVRRRFSLSRLTPAQRKRLARIGRVRVTVRVTGGGTIVLRARQNGAHQRLLGNGRRTVKAKGTVTAHIPLHLRRVARRRLAHNGHIRMTITAVLKGVRGAHRTTVTLTKAHR